MKIGCGFCKRIFAAAMAVCLSVAMIPGDVVRAEETQIAPEETSEYGTKKADKSKSYNGTYCTVNVENYYTRVYLKGGTDAEKKINKKLKKASNKFLKDKTIHSYAKARAEDEYASGQSAETYYDYCISAVGYINKNLVSISSYRYWNAGGVSNIFEGGVVYSLKTGKQIKNITKVTEEKDLEALKKTLKEKIEAEDMGYDVSEIDGMKASDFNFYINNDGSVTICFEPYELGYGGWSKTYTVPGKYGK